MVVTVTQLESEGSTAATPAGSVAEHRVSYIGVLSSTRTSYSSLSRDAVIVTSCFIASSMVDCVIFNS